MRILADWIKKSVTFSGPRLGLVGLAIFFLGNGLSARAATTLAAGDIAFTMYNSTSTGATNPSRFSFVSLVDLTVGTTISFTDIGWNGTGFRALIGASPNETSVTYTTTSLVRAGTQVSIGYTSGTSTLATTATGGTVAYTSGSQSSLFYSTAGDQILAYQGTFGSSASFVAGINTDTSNFSVNTGWSTSSTPGTSESQLPMVLMAGTSAVSVSASGSPGSYVAASSETINAQLNFAAISATTPRNASAWRTIINDPANWTKSTTAAVGFNDSVVSLTVIPEPAVALAFGISALLGGACVSRRRRALAAVPA